MTNKGHRHQGTIPPPNENPKITNGGQHHRDTITVSVMTLATVVLAAMIGLLEISGPNPVPGEPPGNSSGRNEQISASKPATNEESRTLQRIADTIPGLVSLFAALALLLYLWCLFAGTEALLRSAREQPDAAAVRHIQAISSFQGLVLLVVFIAGLSIFANTVSG